MKTRLVRKAAVFLAVLALSLSLFTGMKAVTVLADTPYTLTISFTVEKDGGELLPLEGASFSLYKVASLHYSSDRFAYTMVDPYLSLRVMEDGKDVTLEDLTASGSHDLALSCAAISNTPVASGRVGEDGNAVFKLAEPGMYLVVESSAEGTAAGYTKADPFLVSVPYAEVNETNNGYNWISEVEVAPKTAVEESSSEPESSSGPEPSQPSENRPKTGDDTNMGLYMLLLIGGVAGVAGCAARSKGRA